MLYLIPEFYENKTKQKSIGLFASIPFGFFLDFDFSLCFRFVYHFDFVLFNFVHWIGSNYIPDYSKRYNRFTLGLLVQISFHFFRWCELLMSLSEKRVCCMRVCLKKKRMPVSRVRPVSVHVSFLIVFFWFCFVRNITWKINNHLLYTGVFNYWYSLHANNPVLLISFSFVFKNFFISFDRKEWYKAPVIF